MTHKKTPCILCGSTRRDELICKQGWHVFRCASCGLGFLDPLPSDLEMASLYDEAYFADQYDRGIDPHTPDFTKRLRLEGHRIRFFKGLKRGGSVLDLGCGNGYFLAACREKGYGVTGVDISEWAVDYVRGVLGIEVLRGLFDSLDWPGRLFDVVTLWHVLEHTRDPIAAIFKAVSWLKEDGVVVIEVPNYEGTDARRLWEDWVGWQLPYHFYHFTPVTLIRVLDACGLQVIKKKTYHSETIKENLRRHVILRPFARLVAQCYSGTGIAIAAVRKQH